MRHCRTATGRGQVSSLESSLMWGDSKRKGTLMAAITQLAARPASGTDPTARSRYRTVGLGLALVGMMGAVVSVIGNFVAADNIDATNSYQETLAWTFGLSIFSFGVVKIAIAVILMGIIVRLWFRVDAIKGSLATLRGHGGTPAATGTLKTDWGTATVTDTPPKLLPIHRTARLMWRPMLAMGAMALTTGLISSWVWADKTPGTESFRQAAAFTQGVEFLGETLCCQASRSCWAPSSPDCAKEAAKSKPAWAYPSPP